MIKRYKQNEIDELITILKNDGVISVPTDTVYGVCARISTQKAHDRLIQVKNRPEEKAFPVMCANIEQIKNIAIVDEKAEKIINRFMPGPITLVLNKNKDLPDYITNGKNTIAIRMATSEVLKELIEKLKSPLFMTSANQSGKSTCKNLDEIEKACPLLDGMLEGKVTYGKGSTIVDCTSNEIKILRLGPISIEQIIDIIFRTNMEEFKVNFIKEEGRIYSTDSNGKIVAKIEYEEIEEGIFDIYHTFVDESLRGKGIASKLVQEAVNEIQSKNGKIKASCSYAKKWLEHNK